MSNLESILKLSVEERLKLVQEIWDSIVIEIENSDISEEHKKIIDQRIQAHEKNSSDVVCWDDIARNVQGIL